MSDQQLPDRRSVTLGGVQKTRFIPVIPQNRQKIDPISVTSESIQNINSEKNRGSTNKVVRPKKNNSINQSIVTNEPVFGPFSLGPSSISIKSSVNRSVSSLSIPITSQKYHISSSLKGHKMNDLKNTPMGNYTNNDPYEDIISDLTELQHLNAGTVSGNIIQNDDSLPISSSNESLVLVQLPSILPGVEPEYLAQRLASVRIADSTQAIPTKEELEKRAHSAILNEPTIDGKIGKIKIYRSGKTILCIGNVEYVLESGIQVSYLESVAVIDSAKNQIVDLGPISQRLVVYPPIDELLNCNSF